MAHLALPIWHTDPVSFFDTPFVLVPAEKVKLFQNKENLIVDKSWKFCTLPLPNVSIVATVLNLIPIQRNSLCTELSSRAIFAPAPPSYKLH